MSSRRTFGIRSAPLAAALLLAACASQPATTTTRAVPESTTTTAATSTTSAETPLERELGNGLRVQLLPDGTSGNAAVMLIFDIGERHDPDGSSGLAHLAEHLFVTAESGPTPARSVDDLVAAYPLGWNAQTLGEATIVATIVESGDVVEELAAVADRLAGVTVSPEVFEREQGRVLDEVGNMFGGIPQLAAQNLAHEMLLPTSADGRRGGDPEQVAGLTLDQVAGFLDRHYRPVNALLVVSGAFDPADVSAVIDTEFGQLAPGEDAGVPVDGATGGPGRVEAAVTPLVPAAGEGVVALGFLLPTGDDPSYPAMLVQAYRLLLASASGELVVSYAVLEDPRVMTVTASIQPGESPDEALQRLGAMVDEVVGASASDGEVTAARSELGVLLGLAAYPSGFAAQNPYQPALTAALGPLVVPDPAGVVEAFDGLTPADVEAAASLFDPANAAVVVVTLET